MINDAGVGKGGGLQILMCNFAKFFTIDTENEKEFEARHIMCASGMDAEERRIESASHNSEHNVQI